MRHIFFDSRAKQDGNRIMFIAGKIMYFGIFLVFAVLTIGDIILHINILFQPESTVGDAAQGILPSAFFGIVAYFNLKKFLKLKQKDCRVY